MTRGYQGGVKKDVRKNRKTEQKRTNKTNKREEKGYIGIRTPLRIYTHTIIYVYTYTRRHLETDKFFIHTYTYQPNPYTIHL